MKPSEVPQLLAEIALADPRVRRTDHIELRAQIAMWAGILTNVPYDAAVRYAHEHYTKSTWPILPADIATRWTTAVADRLGRHIGTFEPLAHPELHPDDEAGYRAALTAERHAVATGQQPPNEMKALTAGPAAADVQARLDRMGTYMPASVKDTLAELRPAAVERERLIRSGLGDPLGIACPWDACRAQKGHRCRTGRHERREPHPARTAAASRPGATA